MRGPSSDTSAAREGQDSDRWNLLQPGERRRVSYIERGAATDYIRAFAIALTALTELTSELSADAVAIGATIHSHPHPSETLASSAEAFEGTTTDPLPAQEDVGDLPCPDL